MLSMGVREIERFLERWHMGIRDLHQRTILAPTPRERALAGHLVTGPGLDGSGRSGGTGAGPSHHRTGHRPSAREGLLP